MPQITATEGLGFRIKSGIGTLGGAMVSKSRLLLPKAERSARTEEGLLLVWVDWFWGTQSVTVPHNYRGISVGDGLSMGDKIR